MNPDEENATPEPEQAPVETQEEQPAEPAEAPPEEQEAQESTEPEGEVEAPSQTTDEKPTEEIDWSQYVPNVSAPIPTDENGQVDPEAFRNQMKQELRFESQETRSWMRLEQQHPEISKDPGLREMILAKRMFDVQRGQGGTLEAAAQDVFQRLGLAKNEGKAAQQTSVRVQKSGALQKPSGKQTATAPDARDKIRAGDQTAIHSVLTSWVTDGKI
jgi:hypothetical protein